MNVSKLEKEYMKTVTFLKSMFQDQFCLYFDSNLYFSPILVQLLLGLN